MTILKIPKAAVSMQEGTLAAWLIDDGQEVAEGQAIYTLEIEKSTMDVEAPASGILRHVARAGASYKVGEIIGEIQPASAARSSGQDR
jgi:pyruvate/2-oxoglutarate dehydrogenase complex dihydrolipoamide acyltransferase (E2) component